MTHRDAPNEIRGLADLTRLAVDRVLATTEGTHLAVADRAFRTAGVAGESIGLAHDAISQLVYESIRATTSAVTSTVGRVASLAVAGRPFRPLTRVAPGVAAVSAVNGLWGDEMERQGNDLTIRMGFRDGNGDHIDLSPASLTSQFPSPGTRLVVMIPGLGETERVWGTENSIDQLLASQHGYAQLRLRYNSGLPIPDNGQRLSELLDGLIEAWPVEPEELVLIGHSMGGLVARSAAHIGNEREASWLGHLRHIVTLGSPHLGAPLEKGAHLLAKLLGVFPESKSFGTFLESRSQGIKDLRWGRIVSGSPVASWLEEAAGDGMIPNHVAHHFVAGVVTTDPSHRWGRLVGDLVVRAGSATGQGRRVVEATNAEILGGRNHLGLLTDPEVVERIVGWVSEPTGQAE